MSAMPITQESLPSQEPDAAARLQARQQPISPATVQHAEDNQAQLAQALQDVVEPKPGDTNAGVTHEVDAHAAHGKKAGSKHLWLRKFFNEDTMNKLFVQEQMGQYVIIRATGEQIFEEMPLYVRIGMHLLFVSGVNILSHSSIDQLLVEQSIKQGKIYDQEGPGVTEHIQSFIDQFQLPLDELVEPDPAKYKTFNSFFSRRIKPEARPPHAPHDPSIITSKADCRLTVFDSVDIAKQVWVKGKQFTIPNLLGSDERAQLVGDDPGVAIFRLAPQDYHRFHSGVSGVLGEITHLGKSLYTVNPQAVNENLNVFTSNSRAVRPIVVPNPSGGDPLTCFVVAIGAMLVGSIHWEDESAGKQVNKGDPQGSFAYGGSSVILVTPTGSVKWDQDLVESSAKGVEMLVKVGERIGQFA